ncbi:MAG: hypothetical protein RMM51_10385 [Verrucomicrobiae bacterium]|nr:hypothetical protein [Verrucomicrobiae bacterium]
MGLIQVNPHGDGFVDTSTGERFVPVGVNYSAMLDMVHFKGKVRRFAGLFGVDRETEPDPLAEAAKYMGKLAELGLNVIRVWTEPHDFFPLGPRLDAEAADRFDRFLEICRQHGIYVSVGMHLTSVPTGWPFHNFQPPHQQWLLDQLYLLGRRWGKHEQIFSWTIVGEGQLPWYTKWLAEQWPHWLQFWYNDDLEALRQAWGTLPGVHIHSFADAPIPPRNIGACLGIDRVTYGRLEELPDDPWAGSTWRYDWRLFLEHIGARRVHQEVNILRQAGAIQMITVGANSWTFPNLPASQMTMGYNPYFLTDSLDYFCEHNYPMPQCLPGGLGNPLDSDENLQRWLIANEIMGRIYTSLGKPVVLEEWGWYGPGRAAFAGVDMGWRSAEDQLRYCEAMMETTQHVFQGWMYWMHRDMPHDGDLTQVCGLFRADGTIKPWGKRYGEWAHRLRLNPPVVAKAKGVAELDMKRMWTDDRFHETWWHNMIRDYPTRGPLDFRYVFERKPATDWPNDIRHLDIQTGQQDYWAR